MSSGFFIQRYDNLLWSVQVPVITTPENLAALLKVASGGPYTFDQNEQTTLLLTNNDAVNTIFVGMDTGVLATNFVWAIAPFQTLPLTMGRKLANTLEVVSASGAPNLKVSVFF